MAPEKVRYARSRDGATVAWIESGRGPRTLVIAPNAATHIVEDWINPLRAAPLRFYSEHFRVIRFDDRGFGHSSRGVQYSADLWADDIEAVANECAGSEPFVLLGQSVVFGAVTFAARAPDRLSHLLLYGAKPYGVIASGVPAAREHFEARAELKRLGWGRDDPGLLSIMVAYLAKDMTQEEARFFERRNLSQIADVEDALRQDRAAAAADVRPLLQAIRTPTLVSHAKGDRASPLELGKQLARGIPGAVFVELAGENHALRERDGSLQAFGQHVLDFVYGARNSIDPTAGLSRRQHEILDCVCEGLTNDAIASRLGISEKTVRNHLTQVFEALGVATRTQAAIAAMNRLR